MRVLNITNGDSAVEALRAAGITGDFLPWIDVLHDGPVQDTGDLELFVRQRARFITSVGWSTEEDALRRLMSRYSTLERAAEYEEVILWFEHDLYDQLQLIEVLHRLQSSALARRLTMSVANDYLGHADTAQIERREASRHTVSMLEFDLASRAWNAFTAQEPTQLGGLAQEDTRALPFLRSAILRLIDEYPDTSSGLSRTEASILFALALHEELTFSRLFHVVSHEMEEATFMGDSSFKLRVEILLELGLIDYSKTGYVLTDQGRTVVARERSVLDTRTYDSWIGGVQLTNAALWVRSASSLYRR